jgi:hypothetical protein
MALNVRQQAALRELTARGVLTHDQEAAVREALDEAAAPKGSANRLVEMLGYVGGGLLLGGAALLFATSWEDLSKIAKVVLLGAATLTLVAAGLAIAGGPSEVGRLTHQRRRVVSTLFALASGTTAFTAGVSVNSHEFVAGSAAGLVVAVAAHAMVPTAITLLAVAATSVSTTGASVVEFVSERPLTMGFALFALGVIGACLALAGVLRPVPLALAAGAAVALFGAQHPLAGSDTAVVAYALTGALAIASFAAYLRAHQIVLLVTGVVATTIVVPEAVWDWTDGAVSGGALLLVAGAVLLVASGVGLRLRRLR